MIIQFNNEEVRTVIFKGETWWVVGDVCKILSIRNPSQAITRIHPDDLILNEVIDALGRPQKTNLVSESGLYDLILQSRSPKAATFRRWVTKEVLPSIRKNGFYSADKTLACRFLQLTHAFQYANMLPHSSHKLALKLIKISSDDELGDVVKLVENLIGDGGDPYLVSKIERELPRRIKMAKMARAEQMAADFLNNVSENDAAALRCMLEQQPPWTNE
jgi:prophage antirepressor-like protein